MSQEDTAEKPIPTAKEAGARRLRKARRSSRDAPDKLPVAHGTRYLLPESLRHMQELFELLPRLKLDANCDPARAPPTRLRSCAPRLRVTEVAQLLTDKVHVPGHPIFVRERTRKKKC